MAGPRDASGEMDPDCESSLKLTPCLLRPQGVSLLVTAEPNSYLIIKKDSNVHNLKRMIHFFQYLTRGAQNRIVP